MRTLDDFRFRYSRYTDEHLLTLLRTHPIQLSPEARQALDEEAARRGGIGGIEARVPIRIAASAGKKLVYVKASLGARLGAHIIDRIVGMAPVILAAVFGWIFPVAPPNTAIGVLNLLGTFAWAAYYGLTKDGRPNGQSIGKKMCGLMVVNVQTNEPCTRGESAMRAFIGGLVGIVPVIGWFIEPLVALVRDDGRRLGDQAADTQVIPVETYDGSGLEAD